MTAPYAPTDWVDNATPVDEAHMDKMEAGIAAAVVMDSELAAAVRLVANKLLAADANQAFRIRGDGRIEWGAGGATALDVALYRAGADLLATDDRLVVIRANDLDIALTTQKVGDSQSKFRVYANGRMEWGPGSGATDIILTRVSADILEVQGDTLWVAGFKGPVKAGIPVDGDVPGGAVNGNMIIDTTNSRLYFRIGGVWHYCAINDGAAAGGVDYKGNWAVGTAYGQGDVVLYQGREYIAVNPGTGNTPPTPAASQNVISLVTAFPTTPFDGQTVDFTDSLTTPSYVWRFRYVAAAPSNKWKFVGGAPLFADVPTLESTASTTYVALTTAGPSITIPVVGDYVIEQGFNIGSQSTVTNIVYMSYDIGATAAVDADAVKSNVATGQFFTNVMKAKRKLALPVGILVSRYKVSGGTIGYEDRWLRATPIAVGG